MLPNLTFTSKKVELSSILQFCINNSLVKSRIRELFLNYNMYVSLRYAILAYKSPCPMGHGHFKQTFY